MTLEEYKKELSDSFEAEQLLIDENERKLKELDEEYGDFIQKYGSLAKKYQKLWKQSKIELINKKKEANKYCYSKISEIHKQRGILRAEWKNQFQTKEE